MTFEPDPPSATEMAARIAAAQTRHASLVLEHDGGVVVGVAYGGDFRARPAHAWTCEVSVYLAPGKAGSGGGRTLYEALLARLRERDLAPPWPA